MADLCLLQRAQVLAMHSNTSKNGKTYHTSFVFVPGALEGNPKPQLVELRIDEKNTHAIDQLTKIVGKSADIMAEKFTFKDNSSYSFYSFLSDITGSKAS